MAAAMTKHNRQLKLWVLFSWFLWKVEKIPLQLA
jgi:hypothetical protein